MTKITSSQLKKHFKEFSKEEVIKEMLGLFRTFTEVREFYQSKLSECGDMELREKYKKVIQDEFFSKCGPGKGRLSVVRKAVANFRRISDDAHSIADMLIYYVEVGVAFTREYGDIDEPFYNSMENMYETAAVFVTQRQIVNSYQARFKKMVADTSEVGWGFHDVLADMYAKYFSKTA